MLADLQMIWISDFCWQEAKAGNDPSLNIHLCAANFRREKTVHIVQRTSVSVLKVCTSTEASMYVAKSKADPTKSVPCTKETSPVMQSFPKDYRKKFHKENICFHFCCIVPVKCEECDRESHLSALHPGSTCQQIGRAHV